MLATYACPLAFSCTHICLHTCSHVHILTHVYMRTHMPEHISAPLVFLHRSTHICLHICMHIHLHTQAHTSTTHTCSDVYKCTRMDSHSAYPQWWAHQLLDCGNCFTESMETKSLYCTLTPCPRDDGGSRCILQTNYYVPRSL